MKSFCKIPFYPGRVEGVRKCFATLLVRHDRDVRLAQHSRGGAEDECAAPARHRGHAPRVQRGRGGGEADRGHPGGEGEGRGQREEGGVVRAGQGGGVGGVGEDGGHGELALVLALGLVVLPHHHLHQLLEQDQRDGRQRPEAADMQAMLDEDPFEKRVVGLKNWYLSEYCRYN